MSDIQKPRIVFPFENPLLDPSQPVIYVSKPLAIGLTAGVIATSLALYGGFSIHVWEPTNNRDALFHTQMFWHMWSAKALPILQNQTYRNYTNWIQWITDRGELPRLTFRWLIPVIIGAVTQYKITKRLWRPTLFEKQTGGRKLLEGKEAYKELQRLFNNQITNTREKDSSGKRTKRMESFPLETDIGFNPADKSTYEGLKPSQMIIMPDSQRRTHFLIFGSSRRGKTQIILKRVMWIYRQIRKGLDFKMIINDTPKNDYSKFIHPKHQTVISVDEAEGVYFDIAHDLQIKQDIEQFFLGWIPSTNSKDPFWPQRARAIASACAVYLMETSGSDWDMGAFACLTKKSNDELKEIIIKYYPEASKTIDMADQTISSIMGSMEDATTNILQIAEIYNGYKYKAGIDQMNARMMKHEHNIGRLADWIIPIVQEVEGKKMPVFANFLPNAIFKRIIEKMNEEQAGWKWADLSTYLKNSYADIFRDAFSRFDTKEKDLLIKAQTIDFLIGGLEKYKGQIIATKNDDDLVNFSNVVNGNDMNCNLISRAIFRSLGTNTDININDVYKILNNWKSKGADKVLDIIANNLSSSELNRLLGENDHLTLLAGCDPIFQWAETWDGYESKPRFSVRDWILDESPEKKILCLKNSARFQGLTAPLIRGILFMLKGLVLDKFYFDDKSEAVPLRNLWIIADEFQELGNISEFIEPMLAMAAARGITLMIACQDISQIEKLYQPEFTRFMMSNIGNLIIVGTNQGETAQRLSDHLGKKDIVKLHQSASYGATTNFSANYQQHEALVIKPSEINSKLGLDINSEPTQNFIDWLSGTEPEAKPIRYLYIPSNTEPAFILETKPCSYKVVNMPKQAEWMTSKRHKKPSEFDIEYLNKIKCRELTTDFNKVMDEVSLNKWATDTDKKIDTKSADDLESMLMGEQGKDEYSMSSEEIEFLNKGEVKDLGESTQKDIMKEMSDFLDEINK
jgi:hypothetical protein